ncbi:MAG: prolyl oligopeptidase family serine peptidase [Duncaniella sp.]|nr:prolyl oligopeptidase family serine peptidase [Duncaniella sp.]
MKKQVYALFILMTFFAAVCLSAKPPVAERGTVKGSYNFWFYEPDSASVENPKPLVVFLHGASLCGNNLERVRRYGTIDAIDRGLKLDAYVVAPQNNGGAWKPSKVMDIVDWAIDKHHVDSTRIYVIGMSLGGYGTLDVAATYPDRIAAAMALCGGASVKDLSGLNNLPLWIVHGTADRAVSVGQSDRVVSAIKAVDTEAPRLIYNRVPGMNHGRPARFFYLSDLYDWLFMHSLDDDARPIAPGFDIVDKSKEAYKGLSYKKAKRKSNTPRRKTRRKRRQ